MASKKNTNDQGPAESDLYPKARKRRMPVFDPTGRVEQLMSDETKVADVRRHPIGLFFIYIQTVLGIALAFGLIFMLLPGLADSGGYSLSKLVGYVTAFGIFMIMFGTIFLLLATKIYLGNQLIITDENVTQVLQYGLFSRKVSELSMHNVEDVTAHQHGILSTMFNYGTLVIETAGEQNNFIFKYCPNPNAYAKAVQDARQLYFKQHSNNDQL